jgi:RNA polymerase primary sigma factor
MESTVKIEDYLYIARYVAKRYSRHGIDFEDLVQEGSIGLVKALDKFDPDRGVKFSTYATFWVRQAILEAITNKSRTIRLPAHVVSLKLKVYHFMENFVLMLGYEPDYALIAKELKVEIHKIKEVLELTTEHTGDWEAREECTIEDVLVEEDTYNRVIESIKQLSNKEQLILGMKFGILTKL